MEPTTYGELFEFDLNEMLQHGPDARRRFFEVWLRDAVLFCRRCEAEFEVQTKEVDEEDIVLCPRCARSR